MGNAPIIDGYYALGRDPKFYNKDGSLTVWALVCGYQEYYEADDGTVTRMYADGDCYHVRQWKAAAFEDPIRAWYTFTSIVEARKMWRRLCRASNARSTS